MSDIQKARATRINTILKQKYPNARTSLDYKTPLELLVATILSAQCTDKRVNMVTRRLFKKYKKAKDYAMAPVEELEEHIRSTGFYKNKAKSIRSCCAGIMENHGGKVPSTMEELTKLAGVGRKTANVLLGAVFDTPGVVVDTHVGRVAGRLGLTREKNPVKIERDIMEALPRKEWARFSMRVILFGREICGAKKPKCEECPVFEICVWAGKKEPD